MNKMIKDLYYGEFVPSEMDFIQDEDYKLTLDKYNKEFEKVLTIMKGNNIKNAQDILDKLIDTYVQAQEYECLNAFKCGIKLGSEISHLRK